MRDVHSMAIVENDTTSYEEETTYDIILQHALGLGYRNNCIMISGDLLDCKLGIL